MEYGYNFPNAVPYPQALGPVQYQFGPPAQLPPPDPVLPAGYYPPGQVAIPVPVPRIGVKTHFSVALGLCITWSILLMWPAVIFSIFALIFAQHSRKHLKENSYDKAQSKARTSCFCSVMSLAAATIYAAIFASAVYVSVLVIEEG